MRSLLLLSALFATPADAWEFYPTPVCTVADSQAQLAVQVTYTPSTALYAITLTRTKGDWPGGPVFALTFSGGSALSISTPRHEVSGTMLKVTDTGFGNVLAGMALNTRATASLGTTQVDFDLTGARPAIEAFLACAEGGLA